MMKDLKLAFRLAKYGMNFKMQFSFSFIFLVIGLAMDILSLWKHSTNIIGPFYIVLSAMFLFQMIYSMDLSTMIQSSSLKRGIQLFYPYVAVIPIQLIGLTFVVVLHYCVMKYNAGLMDAETYATFCGDQIYTIFELGVMLFILQIYFGICHKFFVVGTILLFATMWPFMMFARPTVGWVASVLNLGIGPNIGIVYGLLVLGTVFGILLSKVFYKYDISKYAFRNALKRAMR